MERSRRDKTFKVHSRKSGRWVGWCEDTHTIIRAPETHEMMAFLGRMSLELAPSSMDKLITTIRMMLGGWWVHNLQHELNIKLLLDAIKMEGADRIRPKVPLTWVVISRILQALNSTAGLRSADFRGGAFLGLAYLTAARPEEVASLSYGQCEFRSIKDSLMFHLSFETMHLLSDKNLKLRVYFKGKMDKFTQCPYVAISLGNLADCGCRNG